LRDSSQFGQGDARNCGASLINERSSFRQAKPAANLPEVFAIAAVLEIHVLAVAIDARLAGALLDRLELKTKTAQPQAPLQARPSVPAAGRLIGQSAADDG